MQDEMNEETIVYVVQLINELMGGRPHRVAICLYALIALLCQLMAN